MRTARQIPKFLLLAVALLAPSVAAADQPDEAWKQFRQVYPYHYQTVALSEPTADGLRTLIVAEPPAQTTAESLRKQAPDLIGEIQEKKQLIGHDGWVKDLVLTIKPTDPARIQSLIHSIQDELFGSPYRADIVTLPAKRPASPDPHDLDLKVTTADLKKWLIEEKLTFRPLAGGKPVPVTSILRSRLSGVFLGQSKGLVLWVFPRAADLTLYRRSGRQFAVATDLLLGAVSDGTQLVVLGRERIIPTSVLPPLRVETIALLASVRTNELAQSYERTRIFAGRYDSQWDWAPALLSPELLNTEYGSLLNIADQFLKSWSLNGLVEYEHFNYPKPDTWAFQKPLILELNTSTLTFNWNTAGAGYAINEADLDWFALNRTGALPVSYIPEGAKPADRAKVTEHEQKAYDYFAGLGNPYLVRVAEYAAAYQLFRHYRPTEEDPALETDAQCRAHQALAVKVLAALRAVRKADADKLSAIAAGRYAALDEDDPNKLRGQLVVELKLRELQTKIKEFYRTVGEEGCKELAGYLANPRNLPAVEWRAVLKTLGAKAPASGEEPGFAEQLARLSDRHTKVLGAMLLLTRSQDQQLLELFGAPNEVKEAYAAGFQDQPDGWIRTPSIVVSRATGELAQATGGHNLNAEVPVFRPADLPRGKVRVLHERDKLVIEYSPADQDKLPQAVRLAGREANRPNLDKLLETRLSDSAPVPPRELANAVYPSRRLPERLEGETSGWSHAEQPAPTAEQQGLVTALLPQRGPVLIIKRQGNRYRVLRADDQQTIELFRAENQPGLIDYLRTARSSAGMEDGPLHLHLDGFEPHEEEGLLTKLGLDSEEAAHQPRFLVRSYRARVQGEEFADRASLVSKYNFREAEIKEPVVRQLEGQRVEVTTEVEVPAVAKGKPSLLMRIKLIFDQAFNGMVGYAKAAVARFCARAFSSEAAFCDALADLKADLKKYGVQVQLERLTDRKELLDHYRVNRGSDERNASL